MTNVNTKASKTVSTVVTGTEIAEFIAAQVEAPALNYQAIDCSNISLKEYRLEDSDINKAYSDAGITHIKLVNELGEVVPNARLVVSHRSGKDYSIVPFFPLILAVNQAKVELKLENQLKAFSEQGSLKARGSYKFVATPEQIDAMQAKAKMVWEQEVKELNLSFHTYCNGYEPTLSTLPIIWQAFISHTTLVKIGNDCYIRQVIPADSDIQPLDVPELVKVSETPDLIGELLISVCYTYKLQA